MNHVKLLCDLLADGRVLRHRDLLAAGIPPYAIRRSIRQNAIEQVREGSGILGYRLVSETANLSVSMKSGDAEQFALVADRHPNAVLWGVSALRFHELCTRDGKQIVTAALGASNNRRATLDFLVLSRWSNPKMLTIGVVKHEFMGRTIGITDVWRTAIDAMRLARTDATIESEVAHNAFLEVVVNGKGGLKGRAAVERMAAYADELRYPLALRTELASMGKMGDLLTVGDRATQEAANIR